MEIYTYMCICKNNLTSRKKKIIIIIVNERNPQFFFLDLSCELLFRSSLPIFHKSQNPKTNKKRNSKNDKEHVKRSAWGPFVSRYFANVNRE